MNISAVSGHIVDVVSGVIFDGTLEIENGIIASVKKHDGVPDRYILPGLIDAHVHIESSMLLPSEFARLAVVHGTVGTVSDPHEIANVLGIEGVKFMIANASKTPFRVCFGAPSCVPATPFESSGAVLGAAEVEELLQMHEIGYLAEMMNFPGVLFGDEGVKQKLALAAKYGKPVDGHAPGLKGADAETYIKAGITTDHECYSLEEAADKIRCGMHVLIREGSAARNFDTLLPLLESHPEKVMFCSDDKHPDDLVAGHINQLVKRSIAAGYDPVTVLRCCTLNPVKHYGLRAGLLQAGDPADLVIADNLQDFNILVTCIGGTRVAESGKSLLHSVNEVPANRFVAMPVSEKQLEVLFKPGLLNVIEAYDGELITGWLKTEPKVMDNLVVSDPQADILKIVVINRFAAAPPAIGFIKGIGLKSGALASTVAHDSHNIISIGTSDGEIVKAVNLLVENKGGISAVNGGEQLILPLPVAGLMSAGDGYEAAKTYEALNAFAGKMGSPLRAPFMTLSFMALLVIPSLKLSDKGLFDGNRFAFAALVD